jgi:hypothetical protein
MSPKVARSESSPPAACCWRAPRTYCAAKDRAPSARAVSDTALTPAPVSLWQDNYCIYGVRKLWKTARRAGIDIGRDQTGRLMRAA